MRSNDTATAAPLTVSTTVSGVIHSKILPKRLPSGLITRPALLDRLDSARGATLTLLSAPAGFGKTTVLASWVAEPAPCRYAWVCLDPGDIDPVRFWAHVIAALGGVDARAGTNSLAALRSRPEDIEGHALPILLEELDTDGPDLVLILDDYYLAQHRTVDATVAAFMRYRPDRVQLVISTRVDPALGVARLRASGDLQELRAADLRFDDRELQEFLEAVGVARLSDEDTARLAERTGGWPAPLRLLALLIQDQDPHTFISSLTGPRRPVVDYMTTDVLGRLQPHIREFVLRVSILTRMCAPLCDAVVAGSRSGSVLAELERANLFVSADTAGEWFTQHHLFAQAMRLELARSDPELVPQLHRRAAHWFEQNGDLESAADHAIEARDLALATRLVAAQVEHMGGFGRWATVRGWLSRLSWPAAMADPELAFTRAVADLFGHDIDSAERWLDRAATGPSDLVGALSAPLGFRTDLLRSIVGVNDVANAEAAGLRALASAPAPKWEGVALAALGQAQYLRGSTAEARETLHRSVRLIPDAQPNLLAFAIGNLGLAECAEGDPAPLGDMLERGLEMMRSTGQLGSPLGALLYMARGEQARVAGDPRAATGWFQLALEALGDGPRSGWLANAHLLHAQALQAVGDLAGAVRSLDAADAILDRLPSPGALPSRSQHLRQQASSAERHQTEFGDRLSEREVAVLRLAASGLTQREIAEQLFISYNTVKSHLRSAYRKLGSTSREDALVRLADLMSDQAPSKVVDHSSDTAKV